MNSFRLLVSMPESVVYPVGAIKYLGDNKIEGKLFSTFEWGGYISWKLPDKKIFVSGMMPSWRNHYYPGESKNAFEEYLDIMEGKESYEDACNKYKFNTVVLPSGGESTQQRFVFRRALQDRYNNLSRQLISDKWVLIYKDNTSQVFFKEKC